MDEFTVNENSIKFYRINNVYGWFYNANTDVVDFALSAN